MSALGLDAIRSRLGEIRRKLHPDGFKLVEPRHKPGTGLRKLGSGRRKLDALLAKPGARRLKLSSSRRKLVLRRFKLDSRRRELLPSWRKERGDSGRLPRLRHRQNASEEKGPDFLQKLGGSRGNPPEGRAGVDPSRRKEDL